MMINGEPLAATNVGRISQLAELSSGFGMDPMMKKAKEAGHSSHIDGGVTEAKGSHAAALIQRRNHDNDKGHSR